MKSHGLIGASLNTDPAQRQRLQALEEQRRVRELDHFVTYKTSPGLSPNFDAIVARARADGKSWPSDLAGAIIADIQANGRVGEVRRANQRGAVPTAGSAFPDLDGIEAAATREWNADAAIRDEFIQLSTYVAYRRAVAVGNFRPGRAG